MVEGDFDQDLPTIYLSPGQATDNKDVVIKDTIIIDNDGKSEETKIASLSMEKSSTDNAETSQTSAEPETPTLDASYFKTVLLVVLTITI